MRHQFLELAGSLLYPASEWISSGYPRFVVLVSDPVQGISGETGVTVSVEINRAGCTNMITYTSAAAPSFL